jgi:hypothetical protein
VAGEHCGSKSVTALRARAKKQAYCKVSLFLGDPYRQRRHASQPHHPVMRLGPIETIRIWKHEKRNKLLHMVSLVHSFLLHILNEDQKELAEWILREYCHRTGKKQNEAKLPIYRLRWAMSRLWQEIRPAFSFPGSLQAQTASHPGLNVRPQNSG